MIQVAAIADLPPGARKIINAGGKSIGVFNVNGVFVAVLNICPHELAPVCLGRVQGTTLPSAPGEWLYAREGELLMCPWHGWEFDLLSGACLTDHRKLKSFKVVVADGWVHVEV